LEGVYQEALSWEILQRGIPVEREKIVELTYKGHILGSPLRLDLLVGELVIVEVKATTQYNSIYESQLLTYLRLTDLKLGLVINFGEKLVKNGIHRVVNGLDEQPIFSRTSLRTKAPKP
jgi:GxxExxY protein